MMYKHITKFDKINIFSVKLPLSINSDLYNELYEKGVIKKEHLKIGSYYYGKCRNASVARWDGDKFSYMRTKFNYTYKETINHLHDDNGYDLFIPIEEVIPNEKETIVD